MENHLKHAGMSVLFTLRVESVGERIEEAGLRSQVKAAGGKWNRAKKVWQLAYKDVIDLGLRTEK